MGFNLSAVRNAVQSPDVVAHGGHSLVELTWSQYQALLDEIAANANKSSPSSSSSPMRIGHAPGDVGRIVCVDGTVIPLDLDNPELVTYAVPTADQLATHLRAKGYTDVAVSDDAPYFRIAIGNGAAFGFLMLSFEREPIDVVLDRIVEAIDKVSASDDR